MSEIKIPKLEKLEEKLDKEELKKAFDISHFDFNAILRGVQLTLVGAHRAMQNPEIFTNTHYKQAAIAVAAGLAIRLIIAIPIIGIKVFISFLSLFMDLNKATWDDTLVEGLNLIANHVLQIPLFLMTLMRYVTPTLDNMFMDSLRWVDLTYAQKHKNEDPDTLRDMYYPNLRQYKKKDGSTHSTSTAEASSMFVWRFVRKGLISLAIFWASYIPYAWDRQLSYSAPDSSFLDEPYFARIHLSKEQKRNWFRSREGLLFGFGIGFYTLLQVPLLGVLIYGIAEASTAYLITKITDPPPSSSAPPSEIKEFTDRQQVWRNKHEFLNLSLANIDSDHLPTRGRTGERQGMKEL
ncbi:putative transmembrane protein [Eutypa lata UCREL1]|uniref:Putative transmembrane protein n=1 Tax=Eutypa lata (strain UCR-EL1) TaxID=1287681 RepID=M7TV95_EUTLA|nr:putative transmembrane protein [Eutypa lata UCREL1]